jgi:hypothetical protein
MIIATLRKVARAAIVAIALGFCFGVGTIVGGIVGIVAGMTAVLGS